jgi:orotate phosphoribosyltransferase
MVMQAAIPTLARDDVRWLRLRSLIIEHSLKRGEFVLASGKMSGYHFQLSQTILLPEGAALIGEIIIEYMKEHDIGCLGGLEVGATSIASIAAMMSHSMQWPIHAFFVRKAAKTHGARQKIDGHLHTETEILAVDDVATTGDSIMGAVRGMGDYGHFVRRALVVIDREEGAVENLAAHNIQLSAIFKTSDFQL